ncbi:hypothetical protein H2248_010593 [Termitomyces sp. 'cryptogamus']|nr:hypothetical protein H2248_010593 [Termitomyces sp. 'cryptogamus']
MVIKILKYLAQQVYGTAAVVILTPYLGQLQQLRQALRKSNNDPVLNDLDSFDLVKAGLVPAATAAVGKRQIRLATIGEESDVVIVSLTRSNANNDIGFMFSPERLNVLLSRARHALIMIDNVRTFEKSKKGGNLWTHLFKQLKDGKHIYEGMPVRCEQHHNRTAILSRPEDFELHCPDGGCMEPCRTMLKCGQHSCQSKCHQLSDHSKMPCQYVMSAHCPKGHLQTWKCHGNGPSTCAKCEREAKAAEMKRQKDYEEQQKREADQVAHTRRLAELDEAIAQEEQRIHESRATKERVNAIQQKEKDLKAIKSRADNLSFSANLSAPLHRSYSLHLCQECLGPGPQVIVKQNHHMVCRSYFYMLKVVVVSYLNSIAADSSKTKAASKVTLPPVGSGLKSIPPSLSELEWQRQKDVEGASGPEIDSIMAMTGLERVKEQVLTIKAVIETRKRQGASFKRERFNSVLLGNPGTGKTTVARSYGKLLASLQVLPGNAWVETTGARLANDGVAGVKKQLEEVINAGGGTVFVDEAYQLTNAHSFQGKQVLDFLLAEMENNIGTIVFIFAGYRKEMETFFEHNPGLLSRVPFQLQFDDYIC